MSTRKISELTNFPTSSVPPFNQCAMEIAYPAGPNSYQWEVDLMMQAFANSTAGLVPARTTDFTPENAGTATYTNVRDGCLYQIFHEMQGQRAWVANPGTLSGGWTVSASFCPMFQEYGGSTHGVGLCVWDSTGGRLVSWHVSYNPSDPSVSLAYWYYNSFTDFSAYGTYGTYKLTSHSQVYNLRVGYDPATGNLNCLYGSDRGTQWRNYISNAVTTWLQNTTTSLKVGMFVRNDTSNDVSFVLKGTQFLTGYSPNADLLL